MTTTTRRAAALGAAGILGAAALALGLGAARAQSGQAPSGPAPSGAPIKIANVSELSGAGATPGTNWKNGIDLAVAEINAAGGVLGRPLEVSHADSQSVPGTARAQVQKALDAEPYVLLGPTYSGSVKVTSALAQKAGVAQFVGGDAAELTQGGQTHLFRTSPGQQSTMPKVARYIAEDLKAKSVAVIYVNNDFGKGGRDAILKEFAKRGIAVAADVSSEGGQADFAADVSRLKAANAEAIFAYLNEEESARFLKEVRRQGVTLPLIGETTLTGQKVIDLAGADAEGARGHVGLTTDAPVPAVTAFRERFVKRYNYVPDHNGMKGYLAVQLVKAVTEKMGKVDGPNFAKALHGLTVTPAMNPNVLMEVSYDANGDLDRQSYLVEVKGGRQVVVKELAKLGTTTSQ